MNVLLWNHCTAASSPLWGWVGIRNPLPLRYKKYHILWSLSLAPSLPKSARKPFTVTSRGPSPCGWLCVNQESKGRPWVFVRIARLCCCSVEGLGDPSRPLILPAWVLLPPRGLSLKLQAQRSLPTSPSTSWHSRPCKLRAPRSCWRSQLVSLLSIQARTPFNLRCVRTAALRTLGQVLEMFLRLFKKLLKGFVMKRSYIQKNIGNRHRTHHPSEEIDSYVSFQVPLPPFPHPTEKHDSEFWAY